METKDSSQPQSKISILIIEDNEQWGTLLERVMHPRYGFGEVKRSTTLTEGLALLLSHDIRLVMLDLNLPDSRGLSTLARVRSTSSDVAILVMTGDVDQEMALQALREGAQEYLVKGRLSPDEIRHSVRHALERMAALAELRASESLLTSSLDALPSCIAILDSEGRIIATNARWDAFDNPANPLIYQCPKGTDYLRACDRTADGPGEVGTLATAVLQLLAGLHQHLSLDYCVHGVQGTTWFECVGNRFQGKQGTQLVISHLDISERKQLQSKLMASQELFALISEHMEDLLAIIDAQGHRLYSSPSYWRSLGYTDQEMHELSSVDLLHPEDRASVETALQQLFSHDQTCHIEYRLRHKNGEYRVFDSVGRRIQNTQGGSAQALIVARDITERQQAERERDRMEVQLRHAQKLEAIGQLAAGIAHEINTPTQYIGDNTVFLQDTFREVADFLHEVKQNLESPSEAGLSALRQALERLDLDYLEEEIPKAIQQSLEGVSRVSRIVSAMKEFSHPGTGNQERVDLNRAIESTITVSRNEWKYVAELETDLDPSLPLVPCFPGELNQVVLNLIVNAAHAIEAATGSRDGGTKGRIVVSTRQVAGEAIVRVADSGTGIPESIRAKIFEPFFTTKPVGKGTGQGLAIAHSVVVDKHGGRIEVESELGRGTTFILHLPLEPESKEKP